VNGILYILHGSDNPSYREHAESIIHNLLISKETDYRIAYLDCNNRGDMEAKINQLMANGVTDLFVASLVLLPAKHYEQDIVEEIQRLVSSKTSINVNILPPLGVESELRQEAVSTIQSVLSSGASGNRNANAKTAVMFISHGSSKYPEAKNWLEQIAKDIQLNLNKLKDWKLRRLREQIATDIQLDLNDNLSTKTAPVVDAALSMNDPLRYLPVVPCMLFDFVSTYRELIKDYDYFVIYPFTINEGHIYKTIKNLAEEHCIDGRYHICTSIGIEACLNAVAHMLTEKILGN
jgi:sirohydrochlorin ferrochelatase